MEFQGINSTGQIYIEEVNSLPAWDSSYDRRLVYNKSDGNLYYGSTSQWIKVVDNTTTITNHINNTSNPHSVTTSQTGADSHINNTSNPHSVTTSQTGAATSSDLTSHINNTNDPHSTLNGGYVIYYKNTFQQELSGYAPLTYDFITDSYNVNGRVSADANMDRFTLSIGFYRISYAIHIYEYDTGKTPDISNIIYNVTDMIYLDYTKTQCELTDNVQENTLSFSFPIYLSKETQIEMQHKSNHFSKVLNSSLCIEIISN